MCIIVDGGEENKNFDRGEEERERELARIESKMEIGKRSQASSQDHIGSASVTLPLSHS